jgi:hypothetical protein
LRNGASYVTLQVAMGIPLIGAIYENDPNVGIYVLPILIWYPMQLLIGAFLVPWLQRFVQEEKDRLGIADYDSGDEVDGLKKPSSKKLSVTREPMEEVSVADSLSDEPTQQNAFEKEVSLRRSSTSPPGTCPTGSLGDLNVEIRRAYTSAHRKVSTGNLGDPNYDAFFEAPLEPCVSAMEEGMLFGDLLRNLDSHNEEGDLDNDSSLFSFYLTPLPECNSEDEVDSLIQSSSDLSGFWSADEHSDRKESDPRIEVADVTKAMKSPSPNDPIKTERWSWRGLVGLMPSD